jgi:transcription elongation GreA/GreB family factor
MQEKVEEDRYIRAREQEIAESRISESRARLAAAELADKEKLAAKSATMEEIANMLARTGDVVSEAGLANLAAFTHK